MYGVYAWKAGVTAAQVQADIAALLCGAAIADLSAGCDKPNSSVGGAVPGFAALDLPYGVAQQAGVAGGPGRVARVTVSGANRVQLQAVDGWSMGSHSAAFQTTAMDVSNLVTTPGAVNIHANAAGLLIAASDWATWSMLSEVKRDGPVLAGDAAAPGAVMVGNGYYNYMPRLKAPAAVGDAAGPSVNVASAYGALSASAARDRSERLYLPMVPAMVSYSSVPVGEVSGVMIAGGYGQGGDSMMDGGGAEFVLVKTSSGVLMAFPKQ